VHQIVDVAAGKGAVRTARTRGRCAFCGSDGDRAPRLVAGPGLFICDDCVELAAEVVAEGGQRRTERTLLVAVDPDHRKARCSFCGKRRPEADGMAHAPLRPAVGKLARRDQGVRICGDCLRLCDEILTASRETV
jgi:hypothetical protein